MFREVALPLGARFHAMVSIHRRGSMQRARFFAGVDSLLAEMVNHRGSGRSPTSWYVVSPAFFPSESLNLVSARRGLRLELRELA